MARVPLEELVLQIHLLGLGPAAEFLDKVIEPPPAKSITGAVSQLQAIGALTPKEAFTPLGISLHCEDYNSLSGDDLSVTTPHRNTWYALQAVFRHSCSMKSGDCGIVSNMV